MNISAKRPLAIVAMSMALLAGVSLSVFANRSSAQAAPVSATPTAGEILEAPVLLIDIRTPQEWVETGVLPNALLITFQSPAQFLRDLAPHLQPGQPVALICRTGSRTARAASVLAPVLEQPVIDLGGGMFRLMAEGYQPASPTREAGCTIC